MTAARRPLSAAEAGQAARRALAEQREEERVVAVAEAARRTADPTLWQWTALLHRALDDRAAAIAAYERAVTLAPRDFKAAHGLARTRWEAGLPSLDDYGRALTLAPYDGDALLGRAAAQVAAGDRDGALAGIERVLAQEPRWIDGQRQAAQLRYMAGDRAGFADGVEAALALHPRDEALWTLLLALVQQSGDPDRAMAAADRARQAVGDRPFVTVARAVAASEASDATAADRDFAAIAASDDPGVAIHHLRHLLRMGRVKQASALIEPRLDGPEAPAFLPYAAIVWRLIGDARAEWLEGDERLHRTFDLSDRLPALDRLAATLRRLHHGGGAPFDQSVRGGSQTDGVLLANLDADIQRTRRAIVEAVERYVADLPSRDPRHPTLSPRRDRTPRFAGSWSVRLRAGGRHAAHVHPAGWISSALYVALPPPHADDRPEAGWLALGEPPADLKTGLPPQRMIEPKPGVLALFPSTTWHGTRPFADGERLTIAFDIAPPIP